jgi:hypothetical protein
MRAALIVPWRGDPEFRLRRNGSSKRQLASWESMQAIMDERLVYQVFDQIRTERAKKDDPRTRCNFTPPGLVACLRLLWWFAKMNMYWVYDLPNWLFGGRPLRRLRRTTRSAPGRCVYFRKLTLGPRPDRFRHANDHPVLRLRRRLGVVGLRLLFL